MDLNEITVFVKVVQAGSFSQAARNLGMPKSTVSAKVSWLEKRLGITLIQRTTRRLHVTQAGEAYYKRCAVALEEILAAESEASTNQLEPQGTLKITAPVEVGNNLLPAVICDYTKKYPKVEIELLLTDRVIDLVAEGVDLAIRAGVLEDSSLMSRKVGMSRFALLASPAYLKRKKAPPHPKDLSLHECLRFTPLGRNHWTLTNGKETLDVPLRSRLVANDITILKALAVSGTGITLLPPFLCREEMRKGKLVSVLPQWFAQADPVHLLYPAQKFASPKLEAFIELVSQAFKKTLI